MRADVVKGLQCAGALADHEQAIAGDLHGAVIAGPPELGFRADELPGLGEVLAPLGLARPALFLAAAVTGLLWFISLWLAPVTESNMDVMRNAIKSQHTPATGAGVVTRLQAVPFQAQWPACQLIICCGGGGGGASTRGGGALGAMMTVDVCAEAEAAIPSAAIAASAGILKRLKY